ncbi:hypothetical protein Mapa_011745 [Marchantia paleacea]|nr:hypothetical protein Mapa_011745 [Marchantia paleacea]
MNSSNLNGDCRTVDTDCLHPKGRVFLNFERGMGAEREKEKESMGRATESRGRGWVHRHGRGRHGTAGAGKIQGRGERRRGLRGGERERREGRWVARTEGGWEWLSRSPRKQL